MNYEFPRAVFSFEYDRGYKLHIYPSAFRASRTLYNYLLNLTPRQRIIIINFDIYVIGINPFKVLPRLYWISDRYLLWRYVRNLKKSEKPESGRKLFVMRVARQLVESKYAHLLAVKYNILTVLRNSVKGYNWRVN